MNNKVVTRFAPSPTGFLHVGGLRTALYSYLLAKNKGGDFLLRIEDTDQARTVEGGLSNILDSLIWAGIIPDEGVVKNEKGEISQKGNNGPYIQSERLDIYKKYVNELLDNKHAYHCFCTPERLAEVKEERQKNKLPPGYDGFCKNLSETEIQNKINEKTPFVIRLAMPEEGSISFVDEIRGEVVFENKNVDDQVLLKSDGFPTYHLAVVVDDHLMGVTHVVRGEEWISSTPKHLFLYQCFDWDIPSFSHLPLLLNSDKSKLSKRQGDVSVFEYKEKGYLKEALVNFVAFLGWNPGDEREMFTIEDLVKEFSLSRVGKAGAVFNLEKLDWYNREYLKKLSFENQKEEIKKQLPQDILSLSNTTDELIGKITPLIMERINKFTDVSLMIKEGEFVYFFKDPVYEKSLLSWKEQKPEDVKQKLEEVYSLLKETKEETFNELESIKDLLMEHAIKNGKGEVLWPVRVALSGLSKSPDPFVLCFVLGKDIVLKRIASAIALL